MEYLTEYLKNILRTPADSLEIVKIKCMMGIYDDRVISIYIY